MSEYRRRVGRGGSLDARRARMDSEGYGELAAGRARAAAPAPRVLGSRGLRIAPRDEEELTGVRLMICDLDKEIEAEELLEEFSSQGEVLSVEIHRDATGASKGAADIIYATDEAAVSAVEEYHGRIVNGQRIRVQRIGHTVIPRDAPLGAVPKPRGASGPVRGRGGAGGLRAEGYDDYAEEQDGRGNPKFLVSLSGGPPAFETRAPRREKQLQVRLGRGGSSRGGQVRSLDPFEDDWFDARGSAMYEDDGYGRRGGRARGGYRGAPRDEYRGGGGGGYGDEDRYGGPRRGGGRGGGRGGRGGRGRDGGGRDGGGGDVGRRGGRGGGRGGRGGGRGGGGGGGGGRGGGRSGSNKPLSEAELNAQMEAYKNKSAGGATGGSASGGGGGGRKSNAPAPKKEDMDAQLEAYHKKRAEAKAASAGGDGGAAEAAE